MRFIKIPHIDDTWDKVHIKTLSPSSFSWICNGCAYQVLLQKVLYTLGDNTYFCLLTKIRFLEQSYIKFMN